MEEDQKANAGAEKTESVGAETSENKKQTFEEFMSDSKNQAELDRRINKAIEKAKTRWNEINDAEKTEAEKLAKMTREEQLEYSLRKARKDNKEAIDELNAYKMKEQALEIAKDKGVDASLLKHINYKTITLEQLEKEIDDFSADFNKAVENAVKAKLGEDTPKAKDPEGTRKANSNVSRASI